MEGRIDASSPTLFAGLPALEASLRGHVVAVVATDREGGASRCSPTAAVSPRNGGIAAPGDMGAGGRDPDGPGYRRDDARLRRSVRDLPRRAPCDRGVWRVLKHWFRSQLTNEALLGRLYATARG